MSLRRTVVPAVAVWVAAVTVLHLWVNVGAFDAKPVRPTGDQFRVGYIPVTCHLTCPVTHYINERSTGDGALLA